MQISQVMKSYTQPNPVKCDEKRFLSQFLSEMFDSFQQDSTKRAPQYEFKSFVIMATYWVPDLPNINKFFGLLWHSFLIFANDAPLWMIQ